VTRLDGNGSTGEEEAALVAWLEKTLRGKVLDVSRVARWRPAWNMDVEVDGRVIPLHARGEREPEIVIPYRISDEVATHNLLEAHGIPVPHVYGLCDEPYALVMDRLPGHVDMSFASSDDERRRLLDEYLELLARIYEIPLSEAAAAGFEIPSDSAATGLGYIRTMEAMYRPRMEGVAPDPIVEFLLRWLEDNVPQDRHALTRFIPYDAFQFMFADGKITGLLDFELAHVGDPLMDLAALRIRDTIKSIGELAEIGERYEQITGVRLDHEVVEYHTVLYNAVSPLSTGPPLAKPVRGVDWVSYLAWYTNMSRWSFECIAELGGYELEPIDVPQPRPTSHSAAHRHLVEGLRATARGDYELVSLGRLASHLRRVDEIGPALEAADLDDLTRALGHRPDPGEADAELLQLVQTAGPDRDEELVRLLDARAQRMHLTLASLDSLMVRHPPLRSLRPDRRTVRSENDGWPAGAIPGTA
jgi:hypothetical protein